mmetsp:Transcript_1449/g.4027  ORF Transcript_1449/g.4027 Transcript_1449/m.4027 type:complete len:303 (-) Transcript_1449:676-1584(-)
MATMLTMGPRMRRPTESRSCATPRSHSMKWAPRRRFRPSSSAPTGRQLKSCVSAMAATPKSLGWRPLKEPRRSALPVPWTGDWSPSRVTTDRSGASTLPRPRGLHQRCLAGLFKMHTVTVVHPWTSTVRWTDSRRPRAMGGPFVRWRSRQFRQDILASMPFCWWMRRGVPSRCLMPPVNPQGMYSRTGTPTAVSSSPLQLGGPRPLQQWTCPWQSAPLMDLFAYWLPPILSRARRWGLMSQLVFSWLVLTRMTRIAQSGPALTYTMSLIRTCAQDSAGLLPLKKMDTTTRTMNMTARSTRRA